jgi:hypothetical protein
MRCDSLANEFPAKKNPLTTWAAAIAASALMMAACDKTEATGPASTARILFSSPKPASLWHVGDSLRVDWTIHDDPNDPFDGVEISLSPDGGVTWGALNKNAIGPAHANWGKFAWKITDSLYIQKQAGNVLLKGSKTCKVKVAQYSTQDPDKIVSTEAFTIDP